MSWEKEELQKRVDPADFTWIKVKQMIPDLSSETKLTIEEHIDHHVKETKFLINEIRQLSAALLESWKEIERRGACEHVYNMRERRDGKLVDFCFKCRGAKQS